MNDKWVELVPDFLQRTLGIRSLSNNHRRVFSFVFFGFSQNEKRLN